MRIILRTTCWLTFAAVLVGLGWLICHVLPPQPRWVVEGDIEVKGLLPDASAVVFYVRGGSNEMIDGAGKMIMRDAANGAVRATLSVPFLPKLSGDYKHWLWWAEEGLLGGFDVDSGMEWRRPLPKGRSVRDAQLSPEGDLAVLCADNFANIIDTGNGKILHRMELGWDGSTPEARFTPDFLTLASRDLDLCIWDRRKRIAKHMPIRCQRATMSPAGNAVLVEYGKGEPLALLDYPDRARPIELGEGEANFSRDGKYLAHADTANQRVNLWDVATGRLTTTLEERRKSAIINAVFSSDGGLLFATAGTDLAVHELPAGRELWRWQNALDWMWISYEPTNVLVALPSSMLFVDLRSSAETFELRDPATGERLFSYPIGSPPHNVQIGFSDSSRYLAIAQPLPEERSAFFELLKDWLPDGWLRLKKDRDLHRLSVIDIDKAAIHVEDELGLRLRPRKGVLSEIETPALLMGNDGRTLFVTHYSPDSDVRTIECWDIPFARPWAWIIGIPAGIGVGVLAWKWLRRKRSIVRTPAETSRA